MGGVIEPLSRSFSIRYSDVNRFGCLKLSSLFRFMQEMAAEHAAMHHFGFDDLSADNTYWVLSRVMTEMYALPSNGETILITTWPRGTEKFNALRDFRFMNEAGNEIGKATTTWLILDKVTHRPHRPVKLESLPFPDVPDAFGENAGKVIVPEKMIFAFEQTARFSDLDVNNHVNNTRYIDWLMDAIPDKEQNFDNCRLLVNYNSEIRLGKSVSFSYSNLERIWIIEGKDDSRSVVAAKLEMI